MITPDLILKPFAANASGADIQAPPQTSPTGFVNFTDGYTSFYEISLAANNPQAKAVERPIQNYMFNTLTKNAQAWQAQGIPPWYSNMVGGYMKGALVFRANGAADPLPYRSLINNNVSDPVGNPASWEYIPLASEMLRNVPMPSGGPGGPSTLIVAVATDFNTFLNGTWAIQSSAIANGSANAPVYPGSGGAVAGTVEALTWANGSGASTTTVQRYVDVNGQVFVRRGTDGSFPNAWVPQLTVAQLQANRALFGLTTGAANAYALNLVPAPAALVDGMVVYVRFHAANTAAATFNLNGLGAVQLAGGAFAALVGTEINTNSLATLQYAASANAWVIKSMVGSPVQGMTALKNNQFTTLGQVTQLIQDAQINDVEWTNVLNKPDVAINGFNVNFKNIELVDVAPYIDFHFNNDASDYNMRLTNDADKILRVFAKGNASAVMAIGDTVVNVNRVLVPSAGVQLGYNTVFQFNNSLNNGAAYYFASNDTNWYLNYTPSNGAAAVTSFQMNRSNGVISFASRPLFAGQTPWDTGNFNPGNYVPVNGTVNNPAIVFRRSTASIPALNGTQTASLQISNAGSGSALITFLREGVYGVYFGLDTDNNIAIGGWSAGAVSWPVVHTGNFNFYLQYTMAGNALFALGSYGLFVIGGGYGQVGPGTLVNYQNMIYAGTSGTNTGVTAAAGTWRIVGAILSGNYNGANSTTLCQRVS